MRHHDKMTMNKLFKALLIVPLLTSSGVSAQELDGRFETTTTWIERLDFPATDDVEHDIWNILISAKPYDRYMEVGTLPLLLRRGYANYRIHDMDIYEAEGYMPSIIYVRTLKDQNDSQMSSYLIPANTEKFFVATLYPYNSWTNLSLEGYVPFKFYRLDGDSFIHIESRNAEILSLNDVKQDQSKETSMYSIKK